MEINTKRFKMATADVVIGNGVSAVWLEVVSRIVNQSGKYSGPLVVSIVGFDDKGDAPLNRPVQNRLDEMLLQSKCLSTEQVAGTIFPMEFWNPAKPREDLYKRFMMAWPGLYWSTCAKKKRNGKGNYFQRMWSYSEDLDVVPEAAPLPDSYLNVPRINQLEHVISAYNNGLKRRSEFVMSIFDPRRDWNTTPYKSFPCLNQIAFREDSGELILTAVYGKQLIFEKAFGNYLGLCRLGKFLAHETGLRLGRIDCVASLAELSPAKAKMRPILDEFHAYISDE